MMLWWPALAQAAQPGEVRLGIVVSSNRGMPGEEPLLYADKDAERVAELLYSLGGYAPGDVWVIPEARVEDVFSTLTRVTVRAQEIVLAGGEPSLLLFYAGHAGTDGLHLSGEALPLPDLKSAIRVVPAVDRIVVLDACHAGAIARSRGSTLVQVSDRPQGFEPPVDEAWMTSSGPEEQSFEVEDRRGALFTHFFVSGARGAADSDGDNQVTLGELYGFVQVHTAAAAADLGRLQQPRWAGNLSGFALTDLGSSPSGVRVVGPVASSLLVIDERVKQVVAEIPAGAGASVALPGGSYQVVSSTDTALALGRLVVPAQSWTVWDPSTELARTSGVRTRGGLLDPTPWALGVGYRFGLATTPGRLDAHALLLSLERELGRGHALELGVAASWLPFQTTWWEGHDTAVELRLGWSRELVSGPVSLSPGLAVSAGLARQGLQRAPHPVWGAWYGVDAGQGEVQHWTTGLEAGALLEAPMGAVSLGGWAAAGLSARRDSGGLTPSATVRLLLWVPFR
jgi:hypothetical protein